MMGPPGIEDSAQAPFVIWHCSSGVVHLMANQEIHEPYSIHRSSVCLSLTEFEFPIT